MSSGPDVHPAQAEQRDPPASPTTILLIVGAAILVVIVFALEVMHAQFMDEELPRPDTSSPGAMVRLEQVSYLQNGEVPSPPPPEQPTARKRGMTIEAAMQAVQKKYGKRGQ